MKYTLHQLHVFVEIVNQKSITKASERLHLTQPAVSIQLKKFQDQFPLPLTEIIGRKLYVTDLGNEIAELAKDILKKVDLIDYKVSMYQGNLAGKLNIAVVSTGKYVMPYYLTDFVSLNKAVDFNIDVTNKLKVIERLENNKVDFALVSVLPKHISLDRIPLLKNRLFLVGGKQRETKRKGNKDTIFFNEPLLFREPGSATRNAMELFLERKKIPIKKKIELTSNEALKQAVIAGLGYSIMPMIGIKDALNRGEISIIPYNGLPIETQWNLIWLKQKKMSPVAQAYIAYLRQHKQTIRQNYFE